MLVSMLAEWLLASGRPDAGRERTGMKIKSGAGAVIIRLSGSEILSPLGQEIRFLTGWQGARATDHPIGIDLANIVLRG
jgi:hypothetical protein